ncbi:hypothetical protein AXE73_05135 [Gardnerella vaginalis]|uniref:Uncharacterized protein n=1 Tax=Gardnerella vaginalis TaxID=2702 RepID=A0A3D8TPB5_GARVA|nr:hypothetical protein gvb01_00285 [Gardnerella vaginalis]RFD78136.1 hypothetical protein AXE73_05135 [Gardnerella vaginalis]
MSGSALRIGKSLARSKRANVFAARKVHWTLRLSGSALRIAFARYALSSKAGRRATRDFALSAHYVILFKLSFVVSLAQ